MGATAKDIVTVITHRLRVWGRWDALVATHGVRAVEDAIEYASWQYVGVEEIGSSDAAYMMDSAVRALGEPSIFDR
jgi:hypothetical protein